MMRVKSSRKLKIMTDYSSLSTGCLWLLLSYLISFMFPQVIYQGYVQRKDGWSSTLQRAPRSAALTSTSLGWTWCVFCGINNSLCSSGLSEPLLCLGRKILNLYNCIMTIIEFFYEILYAMPGNKRTRRLATNADRIAEELFNVNIIDVISFLKTITHSTECIVQSCN